MSEVEQSRTLGGAIGIFFLCDVCMIVAINVALSAMFNTSGSNGGLICPITSAIVAAIWKSGSISTMAAVIIAVVVALVSCAIGISALM